MIKLRASFAEITVNVQSSKFHPNYWEYLFLFLTIKAREGEMSGVPLRNIKNNIQYIFIWNRLEKLMPWIYGSYIPIKKWSEDPPPPKRWKFGNVKFWNFEKYETLKYWLE